MTGHSRQRRATETGRREPPGGNRASAIQTAVGKGRWRAALTSACARRCRSIPVARNRGEHSVSARSKRYPRALLVTGSSTRSQRRAAFVFMREGGRRFRRQRSEQYRTSSQAAFHFFLQLKGKPQVSQVFSASASCRPWRITHRDGSLTHCLAEQRCRVDTLDQSPSLTVESARIVAQQLTAQRFCPRARSSQIAKNARANAGSVTSAVRRPLV